MSIDDVMNENLKEILLELEKGWGGGKERKVALVKSCSYPTAFDRFYVWQMELNKEPTRSGSSSFFSFLSWFPFAGSFGLKIVL